MVKDLRYAIAKRAILEGDVFLFRQIFNYIPRNIVARDANFKVRDFNFLLKNMGQFTFEQVYRIAALFDVDELSILYLAARQRRFDTREY